MNWSLVFEASHYILLPILYYIGRKMTQDFSDSLCDKVMISVNRRFAEQDRSDTKHNLRVDKIENQLERMDDRLVRIETLLEARPPRGAHK